MMLKTSPQEAYRRVDFDARISAASPAELVHLCYEHLVSALGTAIHAELRSDSSLKSRSITRALTAITALQLGLSSNDNGAPNSDGITEALSQLYEAARRIVLDSTLRFNSHRISVLRDDISEIAQALKAG